MLLMSLDALAGANGPIPPMSDIDAPVMGVKGLPLCEPNPPWRPIKIHNVSITEL
jgi:hypothetical protein